MQAWAPGSVTGLFAPATDDGAPSRGASFAIEDGVTVLLEPSDTTSITVDGELAPFEPVERVLASLTDGGEETIAAHVDVRPDVPLGAGFGASGAATLATALAANEAFGLDRGRGELLQAAHEAELAAGTGQGDVYIQEQGGLIWSRADGGVGRKEVDASVAYESTGGIDTSAMLADEATMAAAREHGSEQLAALGEQVTMAGLAERSRLFVDRTGLTTAWIEDALERVDAAGGVGSMALFGETVFAVDVGEGVLEGETRVANEGARVL